MRQWQRPPMSFKVICVVLLVICFYGPTLALMLKHSLLSMGSILLPLIGPVVGVTIVVLLVRRYRRW